MSHFCWWKRSSYLPLKQRKTWNIYKWLLIIILRHQIWVFLFKRCCFDMIILPQSNILNLKLEIWETVWFIWSIYLCGNCIKKVCLTFSMYVPDKILLIYLRKLCAKMYFLNYVPVMWTLTSIWGGEKNKIKNWVNFLNSWTIYSCWRLSPSLESNK